MKLMACFSIVIAIIATYGSVVFAATPVPTFSGIYNVMFCTGPTPSIFEPNSIAPVRVQINATNNQFAVSLFGDDGHAVANLNFLVGRSLQSTFSYGVYSFDGTSFSFFQKKFDGQDYDSQTFKAGVDGDHAIIIDEQANSQLSECHLDRVSPVTLLK